MFFCSKPCCCFSVFISFACVHQAIHSVCMTPACLLTLQVKAMWGNTCLSYQLWRQTGEFKVSKTLSQKNQTDRQTRGIGSGIHPWEWAGQFFCVSFFWFCFQATSPGGLRRAPTWNIQLLIHVFHRHAINPYSTLTPKSLNYSWAPFFQIISIPGSNCDFNFASYKTLVLKLIQLFISRIPHAPYLFLWLCLVNYVKWPYSHFL